MDAGRMIFVAPSSRHRVRVDRPPESLVHAIHSSGRIFGRSLVAVALLLLGLLTVHGLVLQPRHDKALLSANVLRQRHEAILGLQIGLQGFALTGDDRYLETYQRSAELLRGGAADAFSVASLDRRAAELYLQLRLAQQAWVDELVARSVGATPGGEDAPLRPSTGRELSLFDAYRQTYERTMEELDVLHRAAHTVYRWTLYSAIGGALLIMLAASVVGFRRTRVLRQAVGEPLSALLARLEGIGRGDLTPQRVTPGPAEFEVLARGLEEAAATLAAAGAETERREAELQKLAERQYGVLRFVREISGSLSVPHVLRCVCEHAAEVAGGSRVVVWLLDDDGASLHPFADSQGTDLQPSGLDPRPAGDLTSDWKGLGERSPELHTDRNGHELSILMAIGARVVGVLELTGPEVSQLSRDALQILENLAVHAAAATETARLHELTIEMAVTDQLTGLSNRRRFDQDLDVECTATTRDTTPLALLIIDMDDFKSYNDTFGHQAGDRALQRLAQVLTRNLRPTDDAYRYGGEEFAIILRRTTQEAAQRLAERLREDVEREFIAPDEPRHVTVSIGVAGLSQHDPTPRAVIIAADAALYDAKHAGRNRVHIARAAALSDVEEHRTQ
jgi:diguanylate cyclase (GGDEF)-like protein